MDDAKKKRLLLEAGVFFAVIIGGFGTVALGAIIMMHFGDSGASRRQNAALREIAESWEIFDAVQAAQDYDGIEAAAILETGWYAASRHLGGLGAFDIEMRRINPDFIAWIVIDGTNISYPVVRGRDNEQYLNTTFFGEENRFGTPFMDYRNTGDFVPHIIIYGHNSRHGDLFTQLNYMEDEEFLAGAPVITLIVNGRVVEYDIFAARRTDVNDYAYFLDFSYYGAFESFLERIGAPPGATQILTLSTCVMGRDDDERMVVQAALRRPGR